MEGVVVMSSPTVLPRATAAADSRRLELEDCLREAAALPGVDAATCRWLAEKLGDEVFNLVVAGEFKRGKSSIINALLGEPLLPAGVVPLTSVVTAVRAGPQVRFQVELRGGKRLTIEPTALGEYATERGNPANAKGVECVIIDHPSPWLANGVSLVDTPGIGSVYERNTDETRKYLPQADAVLFVASVDQPVSRAELDFLEDISAHAGKVFCLLNKTDYLRPEELREALAFSSATVCAALNAAVPIFPVSARLALDGKQTGDSEAIARSGFCDLEIALRRFMASEKTDAWLRSLVRSLKRLLAQARFALDLESKALTDPLERFEANLAAFQAEKAKAESVRADTRVLLEADARRLLEEDVEPRLDAFKRTQQAHISQCVDRWFADLRNCPVRQLQATLEQRTIQEIRSAYESWLVREDVELSRAFEALCSRFWASLQESVDELMRHSSELFGVAFEGVRTDARWTTESSFYYKFWYEPTSLTLLSSAAVLALPRALAGPKIVRRTKARAIELIEMQAGRIRHDLEDRLKKSVHEAERQMLRQIDTTVEGIDTAIRNGMAIRRRSAERAADRTSVIDELRQRIAVLDARLVRVAEERGTVQAGLTGGNESHRGE
jgi:GTP-binding protein EngB required for normal cell division